MKRRNIGQPRAGGDAEEAHGPRDPDPADEPAEPDQEHEQGLGVQVLEERRLQRRERADVAGLGGAHERLEATDLRHVALQDLLQDVEAEQPDRRHDRGDPSARAVALLPRELLLGVRDRRFGCCLVRHGRHSSPPCRWKTGPLDRIRRQLVAADHARDAVARVQDHVQGGRRELDQRFDPAPARQLAGASIGHEGAIVDSRLVPAREVMTVAVTTAEPSLPVRGIAVTASGGWSSSTLERSAAS